MVNYKVLNLFNLYDFDIKFLFSSGFTFEKFMDLFVASILRSMPENFDREWHYKCTISRMVGIRKLS